jgi:hypothetical protein
LAFTTGRAMRGLIDKLTNCFEDGPEPRSKWSGAEAGKYFSRLMAKKNFFYEFKLTRKSRADVGRGQAFLTRRVNFTFNSCLARTLVSRWSRSLIDFFFFLVGCQVS